MESLSPYLTSSGGVRKSSMSEVVDLMRQIDGKLVPKCLFINLMLASDKVVQFRLCRIGAWDILCDWLQVAQKNENISLLIELLTLYRRLPVTVDLLTTNNCPKAIKNLSKHEESGIYDIANDIVKRWKRIVQITKQDVAEAKNTDDGTPPNKKRKLDNDPSKNDLKSVNSSLKVKSESEDSSTKKKTVKIPPTKMRTAGIEDSNDSSLKSRYEVLAKKGLPLKKKPEYTSNGTEEISLESFHQKITIEKRRASNDIHESSGFIDALTSSQPVLRKKKKYSKEGQISKHTRKDSTELPSPNTSTSENQSNSEGMGPKKSSLADMSEHIVGVKKQKRVSWAGEDDLQKIFFFELDETERVNVNRISIEEMKKKEHLSERQMFADGKRSTTEIESKDIYTLPSMKWHRPQALVNVPATELHGGNSTERGVQMEREEKVLQVIYFTKECIPECPEEPDSENFEAKEPFIIPTEDVSLSSTQKDEDKVKQDEECGSISDDFLIITQKEKDGETKVSLTPQLADLVKSMAANLCKDNQSPSEFNSVNENENIHLNSDSINLGLPASQDDKMRSELWDLIRIHYPDLNTEDLTVERVRELLEPLKEELVARKIFALPRNFNEPPPPLGYRPGMGPRRPVGPGGPPMMPMFNRGGGNFRMQPPMGMMQAHPPNNYGPRRPQGPPHMASSGGPPFRQSGPVCRFFQMGTCRHGGNCIFLHPGVNGPRPRIPLNGPSQSQRGQGQVGGRVPFSNGMYK